MGVSIIFSRSNEDADMTAVEHVVKRVHASFPIDPLPNRFFRRECDACPDDFQTELQDRIEHRRWCDVQIYDWAMMGTTPNIIRSYIAPAAFIYYLPSLLIGVIKEIDYAEFALEAIVPSGRARHQRGEWWVEFVDGVSADQRAALSVFLALFRQTFWDRIGEANQALVRDAETIWSMRSGDDDASANMTRRS